MREMHSEHTSVCSKGSFLMLLVHFSLIARFAQWYSACTPIALKTWSHCAVSLNGYTNIHCDNLLAYAHSNIFFVELVQGKLSNYVRTECVRETQESFDT